jgi:hypothetical protein
MYGDLKLATWAEIGDDCPLAYTLDRDDNIQLRFGDLTDGFEVIFTPTALERLLPLATAALAERSRA